ILVELDVVQLAIAALDPSDIDVLDDVARLRVDRHRAARTLPCHAFHRGEQRVAVGIAAGLFQRRVDQVHGVVDRDADVVGAHSAAMRSKPATKALFLSDSCAAEYCSAVVIPSIGSPSWLRMSPSVMRPVPISRMPDDSRPRSAYWRTNDPASPPGTQAKIASGLASRARCRNGAKSSACSGTRTVSTISPPPALNASTKAFSVSSPGA